MDVVKYGLSFQRFATGRFDTCDAYNNCFLTQEAQVVNKSHSEKLPAKFDIKQPVCIKEMFEEVGAIIDKDGYDSNLELRYLTSQMGTYRQTISRLNPDEIQEVKAYRIALHSHEKYSPAIDKNSKLDSEGRVKKSCKFGLEYFKKIEFIIDGIDLDSVASKEGKGGQSYTASELRKAYRLYQKDPEGFDTRVTLKEGGEKVSSQEFFEEFGKKYTPGVKGIPQEKNNDLVWSEEDNIENNNNASVADLFAQILLKHKK